MTRKWTAADVGEVIAAGRSAARRILQVFSGDPNCDLDATRSAFQAADPAARKKAIAIVRSMIIAEGTSPAMAGAYIDGGLLLMEAGHPLDAAADYARKH